MSKGLSCFIMVIHYAGMPSELSRQQVRALERSTEAQRYYHVATPVFEAFGISEPMEGERVSGDRLLIEGRGDTLRVFLADGKGHGPHAGYHAHAVVSEFRARIAQAENPLEALLDMSTRFGPSHARDVWFSTFQYLRFAAHGGDLNVRILNAGHLLPVVYRYHVARAERLDSDRTLPIGLYRGEMLVTSTIVSRRDIRLRPGDLVCAHSDGFTEAYEAESKGWGLPYELARKAEESGSLTSMVSTLQRAIKVVDAEQQPDDKTVVVVRVRPRPGSARRSGGVRRRKHGF